MARAKATLEALDLIAQDDADAVEREVRARTAESARCAEVLGAVDAQMQQQQQQHTQHTQHTQHMQGRTGSSADGPSPQPSEGVSPESLDRQRVAALANLYAARAALQTIEQFGRGGSAHRGGADVTGDLERARKMAEAQLQRGMRKQFEAAAATVRARVCREQGSCGRKMKSLCY